MAVSQEEIPSLYEFVLSHYQEGGESQQAFKLIRFWNSTKFELTPLAKAFINTMKENWDNEEWDEAKWKQLGLRPIKEIQGIIQQLEAEQIVLKEDQITALSNGYRWALLEIVIKGYPGELNQIIVNTKGGKKKKDKEANEAAQQKLRDFSKAMKTIKGFILADYTQADLEQLKEDVDASEVPQNADGIREATLRAIASGSKGSIQGVIDTYYTEGEHEDPEADDKPLLDLPQDQWDARKNTLESFKENAVINLTDTYLFKDSHENDPVQIKDALYGLFNYIDKISDQDSKVSFGKNISFNIGQRGGADKKDSLKDVIKGVARAESLEAMEKIIHDALNSDRKEKGSVLENRGFVGGYWIGSLFTHKVNPVDGKYVNSTTESYLVSLYEKVKEQKKLVAELAGSDSDDGLFANNDKSFV